MTTAESFDPASEPAYLRVVADGERAPRLHVDDTGHLFARTLPDAWGDNEFPVDTSPVELTEANLWARIAQLEEDRERLSARCDRLEDRLDRHEATLDRMRGMLAAAAIGHDTWHLRGVIAQIRDLLR